MRPMGTHMGVSERGRDRPVAREVQRSALVPRSTSMRTLTTRHRAELAARRPTVEAGGSHRSISITRTTVTSSSSGRFQSMDDLASLPFDDLVDHVHRSASLPLHFPPWASGHADDLLAFGAPGGAGAAGGPGFGGEFLRSMQQLLLDDLDHWSHPPAAPLPSSSAGGWRRAHDLDSSDRVRTSAEYESLLELDRRNVHRGVSAAVLARLPVVKAARADANTECQICKDRVTEGATIMKLPCRHLYHRECISKWFTTNRTCPVCRYEVGS